MCTHDEVANDGHAGTVARVLELVRFAREELLVGHLRIVFLRLYKLMVEVKVVRRSCHELVCAQERLYQQAVQLRGGIEVIALARVRGVGRVSRGQF